MSVIVVGLEHTRPRSTCSTGSAVTDGDLHKALGRLRDQPNLSEAVVLSTCLRTEVYAVVDRFHDGVAEIQEFLSEVSGRPVEALAEHCTIRFDDDVATHLFSVAAGLESAVLGESEVLGQVRRAWERAQGEPVCGPVLGALFRHAVETGQAGPFGDGHRPGHHLALLRRGGTRRRPPARWPARCRGSWWSAPARWARGSPRPSPGTGVERLVVANRTTERVETLVASLPDTVAPMSRPGPSTTSVRCCPERTWSSPPSGPRTRSSIGRCSRRP